VSNLPASSHGSGSLFSAAASLVFSREAMPTCSCRKNVVGTATSFAFPRCTHARSGDDQRSAMISVCTLSSTASTTLGTTKSALMHRARQSCSPGCGMCDADYLAPGLGSPGCTLFAATLITSHPGTHSHHGAPPQRVPAWVSWGLSGCMTEQNRQCPARSYPAHCRLSSHCPAMPR
jgi:hypothetical protein